MDTIDIEDIQAELLDYENSQTTCCEIYTEMIDDALNSLGKKSELMKVFRLAKTDFCRIFFLLKVIQKSNQGFDQFKRLKTREEVTRLFGKSDKISELNRLCSLEEWNKNDVSKALHRATSAVFYALSPEQKAMAYSRRCNILFNLGLIHEAIRDGERSLAAVQTIRDTETFKLSFLQEELAHVHLCLGESYIIVNRLAEAKTHFNLALRIYIRLSEFDLLERIVQGMVTCNERSKDNKFVETYHSEWQCYRSEPPVLKTRRKSLENAEGPEFKLLGHSLSVPKGLLRLKNTGTLDGWALEVTRNVSVGEVLLLEKAYAMSLYSERTMYCYICYKRCLNLIPCNRCPHVGFCSEECAKEVVNPDGSADGRKHIQPHLYDCQGVLALFYSTISEDLLHAAFNCISNTTPECLLDYCCSTGQYEKSGRGHQAFTGAEKIRRMSPPVFDSSDYSSIAWLCTCSDQIEEEDLWRYTLYALFLTYCFHLGGYPMVWFDEFDDANESLFFQLPSPSNRPTRIPASWLAACLLFHIQSNDVNNFEFGEVLLKSKKYHPQSHLMLGSCHFPTLSLINHSCEPSTAVCVTDKGRAFLFALEPISAGKEITISYGPALFFMDKSYRQRKLKESFHFTCTCQACVNNWAFRTTEIVVAKREEHQSEGHQLSSLEIHSILAHKWFPWLEKQYLEGKWTTKNLKDSAKVDIQSKCLSKAMRVSPCCTPLHIHLSPAFVFNQGVFHPFLAATKTPKIRVHR
nr:SET and MYND domain containing protein 4 [Hymenolepis microstoma]